MACEWRERLLGELTENFDGRRVPVKEADRRPGPYPYYGASGIVDYVDSYLFDGEYLLIAEDGENLRTRNTPVAFLARGKFWLNNHAHIVRGNDQADTRYLMYALQAADINGYLTGSTMPKLTQGNMNRILLPAPELPEQRAIAHILGALDDKIELSRRMNETLEAMARAIFKSWFVDFDPVRAKAEGRQPAGMDADSAALFPDSFEDSPLAKIPKGWRMGTLGDLADSPRRGINPSDIAPGTPYIGLEHMPRKCIALSEWGYSDGVASNKFRFAEGNILFGKLRPYFHKVGIAAIDGVCSTDILVIVPKLSHWLGVVAAYVSTDEFIQYAAGVSTGTKMPRTNWNDMARYEIVVPDDKVARAFTEKIKPMIDTIRSNIHHSRTLGAIRDALLPKLLSGEIRVRDAEKLAERAV